MNLLLLFITLNILNVVIQTIKSLATVKAGKTVAALINALAYGLYTIVLVYMSCDLSLVAKVAVVATANLIGVYIVKLLEEKMQKDKLWKIETTIPISQTTDLIAECLENDISHNHTKVEKYSVFNLYAPTQKESRKIKKMLESYDAKYFVTEAKTSLL